MEEHIQSDSFWQWLVVAPLLATLHNFEEYLGFEVYAERHQLSVSHRQLQIALSLATVIPALLSILALRSPKRSNKMVVGLSGPAMFAMNSFSHVGQTVMFQDYSPGTATAVGFNVPFAILFYRQAISRKYLTFGQVKKIVIWGTVLMVPILIILQGIGWVGARLTYSQKSIGSPTV